jgi:hypothetical protein
MLETGFIVALGLLVMLAKLSWRNKMLVISHPLTTDLAVFTLLTMLHWGTFSGVMAATVGALFCSIVLSTARWLVGHMDGNIYFPGIFNIAHRLRKPSSKN